MEVYILPCRSGPPSPTLHINFIHVILSILSPSPCAGLDHGHPRLPNHLLNMANLAKLPRPSSLSNLSCLLPCSFPSASQRYQYFDLPRKSHLCKIHARLGGGTDGEAKPSQKKKFITKEEEPDQYWQTAGEREGENPMKTPLPYIIIFGMSTPFVILAIAFANGWIKVPVR